MLLHLRILLFTTLFLLIGVISPAKADDIYFDQSFSDDGMAIMDINYLGLNDSPVGVAVDSLDRIIVVTNFEVAGNDDIYVTRFDNNGVLDTTFGTNGFAFFDSGLDDMAYDLAIDGNDNIVIVGYIKNGISEIDNDFLVVRFNNDGDLDISFNSTGFVEQDFFTYNDEALSVNINNAGKITVGGVAYVTNDYSDSHIALMRLNNDGSLDTEFDSDGLLAFDYDGIAGGIDQVVALAFEESSGHTFVLSYVGAPKDCTYVCLSLMKLRPRGGFQMSFDSDGKTEFEYFDGSLFRFTTPYDLAFDSSGDVFVLGKTGASCGGRELVRSLLIKFNPVTGALDTSFDSDGYLVGDCIDADFSSASPSSLEIDTEDRLWVSIGVLGEASYGDVFFQKVFDASGSLLNSSMDFSIELDHLFLEDLGGFGTVVVDSALDSSEALISTYTMKNYAATSTDETLITKIKFSTCSDSVVEGNEECDDGNLTDGDGCDSNCKDESCSWKYINYHLDSDGDGYGDASTYVRTCGDTPPVGPYVYLDPTAHIDCDDSQATVYPGATEICDDLDNDCDGQTDEGLFATYYEDSDGDGFGNSAVSVVDCTTPAGYVEDNTDCDDTESAANPDQAEICDGIDNNCNGSTDEGLLITYYQDSDGDGYGNAAVTTEACSAPAGYVADNTDCDDTDPTVYEDQTYYLDGDGDGYGRSGPILICTLSPSPSYVSVDGDCDDVDSSINPGAAEICDSIDNNCDGSIDEGLLNTYYLDLDIDGYGTPATSIEACTAPPAYADNDGDCDDSDSSINPGATESCDGADNDCDGSIDEDVKTTYYRDFDSDGYGNSAVNTEACTAPAGYVDIDGDCIDTNATINPGATESCDGIDNNCDGSIDEGVTSTFYQDSDGDSYGNAAVTSDGCSAPAGYVSDNTDCDDTSSSINPAASESCDGIDNNCDGAVDEGVTTTFYQDSDGDSFGNAAVTSDACSAPAGYVANDADCDDTEAEKFPGNPESCDGLDNNCNGSIDEGAASDAPTWYFDDDSDGYGDNSSTIRRCSVPAGYVADNTDCDDTSSSINPGQSELCSTAGIDDNCNGEADEDTAADANTYYLDSDGDTYGDASSTTAACSLPSGYVENSADCDDSSSAINPIGSEICGDGIDQNCDGSDLSCSAVDNDGDGYSEIDGDCDDTNSSISPDATEICDGIDNDCDGSADEADAADADTFYLDSDGDGYGDSSSSTTACSLPAGHVENSTDCDDSDASINPAGSEICGDGIDQNCDGSDLSCSVVDNDGDGYSEVTGDCDDTNASISPDATENCDGIDNDCDGSTDEADAADADTFYLDSDGDSYGDASSTTTACSVPAGYVENSTDCDDSNAGINPGAIEDAALCDNTIDENCDGTDLSCAAADADGDGYTEIDGDCDDTNSSINPDASETCDGVDNDCDGSTDEADAADADTFYLDSDGDSFGDATSTTTACSVPAGYVDNSNDCDDSNAAIKPTGLEICGDGIDQNCDGSDLSCSAVDNDGDGYAEIDGDCDDSNASINPGATEICDSIDNDCDGSADEADAADADTFYLDSDGDTYGDASSTVTACSAPAGYVDNSNDCDDTNDAIKPTGSELCGDGIDQNCDGSDLSCADVDEDGDGFTDTDGDCDDSNAAINPGASEICDSIDNDCDSFIDEADAADASTFYLDSDGDSYGDSSTTATACSAPSGYVANDTDCDDTSSSINPTAAEVCGDGIDQNCDGTDLSCSSSDADGDGFSPLDGDCDDTNASINPAASESCDSIDNDCDGSIDEADAIDGVTFYLDSDSDGFGDGTETTTACSVPAGYTSDNSDCDDSNASINTSAIETCDSLDNNCDGEIDEGGVCSSASASAICGDGILDDSEECDDGNTESGDGCSEICESETAGTISGGTGSEGSEGGETEPGETGGTSSAASSGGCSLITQTTKTPNSAQQWPAVLLVLVGLPLLRLRFRSKPTTARS